jgi:hypothetical protein
MCNAGSDCFYADGNEALPPSNCGLTIGSMGCFREIYRLNEAADCLIGLIVSNHRTNCRLLLAREFKISADVFSYVLVSMT